MMARLPLPARIGTMSREPGLVKNIASVASVGSSRRFVHRVCRDQRSGDATDANDALHVFRTTNYAGGVRGSRAKRPTCSHGFRRYPSFSFMQWVMMPEGLFKRHGSSKS